MEDSVHEIRTCEVCGNERLSPVLALGPNPMCDDLVPIGDSRVCREYPIEILFCQNCVTAHQRYQVAKRELFPTSYHYRSRFTADVLSGMENLVESCEQRFGSLAAKTVIDIGCNDGSLLDSFRKKGAVSIGIEPTDAALDARQKGHNVFHEFLSEDVATRAVAACGKPDLITFTNVFAHIEDLQEVLRSLKQLMGPRTVIIIENHYLGAVLDQNQFDTFYHEHPRTYSFTSFVHMARSLNANLLGVEFPSRYGGNIRVFIGNSSTHAGSIPIDSEEIVAKEARFFERFAYMKENIELWKKNKGKALSDLLQKNGKIRAKAFPGRAAILVNLLRLTEDSISAVYEKPGSLKIGHYVPGTRIPILSDDELFALSDSLTPLLNLAWHIPQEIRRYLAEHGYTGRVVDILSVEDFSAGR